MEVYKGFLKMINSLQLYKLFVANFYPKCVNCIHYKPGIVTDGYCNNCGLEGKHFKKESRMKGGNIYLNYKKKKLNDNYLFTI